MLRLEAKTAKGKQILTRYGQPDSLRMSDHVGFSSNPGPWYLFWWNRKEEIGIEAYSRWIHGNNDEHFAVLPEEEENYVSVNV
jgi:hypothetical protein